MIWNFFCDTLFFEKLGIKPEEAREKYILMTEAINNPTEQRKKLLELLFEKFEFNGVQIGIQALLSVFAEGRMSALLVDSGDGVSHCIPVVDGFVDTANIGRVNLAGRHLTEYLIKLLF